MPITRRIGCRGFEDLSCLESLDSQTDRQTGVRMFEPSSLTFIHFEREGIHINATIIEPTFRFVIIISGNGPETLDGEQALKIRNSIYFMHTLHTHMSL